MESDRVLDPKKINIGIFGIGLPGHGKSITLNKMIQLIDEQNTVLFERNKPGTFEVQNYESGLIKKAEIGFNSKLRKEGLHNLLFVFGEFNFEGKKKPFEEFQDFLQEIYCQISKEKLEYFMIIFMQKSYIPYNEEIFGQIISYFPKHLIKHLIFGMTYPEKADKDDLPDFVQQYEKKIVKSKVSEVMVLNEENLLNLLKAYKQYEMDTDIVFLKKEGDLDLNLQMKYFVLTDPTNMKIFVDKKIRLIVIENNNLSNYYIWKRYLTNISDKSYIVSVGDSIEKEIYNMKDYDVFAIEERAKNNEKKCIIHNKGDGMSGCFSADSFLITNDLKKIMMKNLKIGDMISSIEIKKEKIQFQEEKVLNFLDHSRTGMAFFHRIYTQESQFLEGTPNHLVFVKRIRQNQAISGKIFAHKKILS